MVYFKANRKCNFIIVVIIMECICLQPLEQESSAHADTIYAALLTIALPVHIGTAMCRHIQ